jgi:hypothetical protein
MTEEEWIRERATLIDVTPDWSRTVKQASCSSTDQGAGSGERRA